nr:hypothetical protein [Tanacetum cinerariifolium]
MTNPEDITDPTTAINMALLLMAKAFKLNYSTPTNNNQRISSNPRNMQIDQPGMNMGQDRQMQMFGGNGGNQFRQYAGQNTGNLNGYNVVQNGVGHFARDCTVRTRRRDAAYLQTQLPEYITDPTTAMNMALALMAKAFKLNYSIPTNNNQRISSNPKNRQITQPGMNMGQDRKMQMIRGNGGNQFRQYAGNPAGYNDVIGNQTQLLIAHKEEAGIQLHAEEYDLMVAAADLDKIKEVNANCSLMANLQQASTSGTQTDSVRTQI